ncbi:hypothetical protein [Thermococcus sp. MV11]|uniref:COG1470 family protein n=1 Tax=Thermococcus sp. MV11 TaxID=1638267 RepID=UPI001430488A|nr:hypothetical protein [Thermococcus sp. MV11]NJE03883.1 hypothetical protein [Thermococcus sp. MV11]
MEWSRVPLIPLLLLLLLAPGVAGYIGVSGDFYSHTYYVPIGGTVTGSTVVISNPSNETIHVRMTYQVTPQTDLLTVEFSENEFILQPGERKVVYVTLKAAPNCPPGNYTVTVGGEEIKQVGNVSVATPSGALKATVIVTGEGARVTITTVDVTGNVVPVDLVLLSMPSKYPIKRTDTGKLEAIVAPGKYRAEAYLAGQLLNATEFEIGPNEEKEVRLVVKTVYFVAFDVVPAKNSEGRIGYAYVVATVRNLFKPLKDAEVVLRVSYNGKPVENVSVSKMPLLPLNDTEFKYNYVPIEGWKPGKYEFQMLLYSSGKLYAKTEIKTLEVTAEMAGVGMGQASPSQAEEEKTNVYLYIGLGALILVVLALLAFRKKSPIKVTTAEIRDGKLTVRVENTSNREAMLLRLRILALPSKVEITDIRKPKLVGGGKKIAGKSIGTIEVPDDDGSIRDAMESGGILVRVETNIGVSEAKFKT